MQHYATQFSIAPKVTCKYTYSGSTLVITNVTVNGLETTFASFPADQQAEIIDTLALLIRNSAITDEKPAL